MKDLIALLHKEDGVWLSFTSSTGKSALINLDTFGAITRAAIMETVGEICAALKEVDG